MMTSFPPDSSAEAAFQCKKIKSRELLWKTIGMYMNTKQRRGRRRGRKHKERKCRHKGDERETEEDGGEQNREEEHSLNIFHGHTVNHYFGFDYQVGRARLILADNNSFLKSDWIKRWADNPFFKADRIKTAGGWFKSCRWLTVSRDVEDDTQEGNVLLGVSKSRLHWGVCVCVFRIYINIYTTVVLWINASAFNTTLSSALFC